MLARPAARTRPQSGRVLVESGCGRNAAPDDPQEVRADPMRDAIDGLVAAEAERGKHRVCVHRACGLDEKQRRIVGPNEQTTVAELEQIANSPAELDRFAQQHPISLEREPIERAWGERAYDQVAAPDRQG